MIIEYVYFSLSKSMVDFQKNLLDSYDIGVNFKDLGSVVNSITLNRNCASPKTGAVFLTQSEYDSLANRGLDKLKETVLSKITVIESSKALEEFFRTLYELDKIDEEREKKRKLTESVVEPIESGTIKTSSEFHDLQTDSVDGENEEFKVKDSEFQSETEETFNDDMFDDIEVEEPTEVSAEQLEKYSLNTVVLNLKAEIERLEDELYNAQKRLENPEQMDLELLDKLQTKENELNIKISELDSSLRSVEKEKHLLSSQISNLEVALKQVESSKHELETLNSRNKESLKALIEEKDKLENKYFSLEHQFREYKSNAKTREINFSGSVPRSVRIVGVSSEMHLPQVYQYLVTTATKNSVIIDVSQVSVMDIMVKVTKTVRPTKWLIDGVDIRTVFSNYEPIPEFPMSAGVSIATAPTYLYPSDWIYRVDWTKSLNDLANLQRPVILFLGNIHSNGVADLMNTLDTKVTILTLKGDLLEGRNSKVSSKIVKKSDIVEYEVKRGE